MTASRRIRCPAAAFLDKGHAPQVREPALGYASRLAALNGVDVRKLCADMRLDHHDLRRGDESALLALSRLRSLGEAARTALGRYTPRHPVRGKGHVLAGNALRMSSVLGSSVRFCPHCIAGDLTEFDGPRPARPWLRLEWSLDHVRVCRAHGNLLVDLPWTHPVQHPFDFSRDVAVRVLPVLGRLRAGTVPGPGGTYADWIVGRLDGALDPGNWLDDVPLHAAMAFCEALGFSVRHGSRSFPSGLEPARRAAVAEEGYRVACLGRSSIDAALDRMVEERPSKRGFQGHRKTYGHLVDVLGRCEADPDYAKLRAVVREHAFARLPFKPGRTILGAALEARRVYDIATAAASLGRTSQSLARFVTAGDPARKDGAATVARGFRIAASELVAVASDLANHVTINDVMRSTGFERKLVIRLAEAGLMPSLPPDRRPGGTYHAFLGTEVEEWMAGLFRDARSVPGPTGRRLRVADARRVARAHAVDILDLIVRGRLSWVGRIGDGRRYEHLMVDVDEVIAILHPPRPTDAIHGYEALAMLPGVKARSVALLARAGLLSTTTVTCPKTRLPRPAYSRENVEAFAREYVSLHEICLTHRIRHAAAARDLGMAGVDAAIDPALVGTPIFRRSDVAASGAFAKLG